MSKRIKVGEDKIYDADLPIPKFNQFDPVLYNGIRTEIANSANYYALNDNDVMCAWYYVPILLNGFIYIELVPETDLTKFTGD